MNKKKMWRINIALLILAGVFVLVASNMKSTESETYDWTPTENVPQIIKGMNLNKAFSFCGESLDMTNFDIRERLDRELSVNAYWHSSTLLAIKSSMRYFPTMDHILKEEGVPTDLKYLAVAESALRNAVSPAGAKGIWQFMKGTAGDYGLETTNEVDERYHVEKSTRAAARYLKSLHNRFGNWSSAAAAYNMGGGNLSKHLKLQRTDSYFDLNLNEETARYYFRLVAIKEILENPRAFGFYLNKDDYYQPLDGYRTITINTAIENWGDFAKEHGISYRLLKIYNPWLIDNHLTNRAKKTYDIKIPV